MKKNHFKVLAALMLTAAITIGSAIAVPGIQSGTIMGENDVANMIVSVIVPSNFNFVIDPLETSENSVSQIAYTNYFFINKTGAPVKVSLNISAELNNGATLVDNPSMLSKDDFTSTEKRIYFALLGADALEPGDLSFNNMSNHSARGIYDPTADTIVPFDVDTKKASVEFVLAPATQSYQGSVDVDTLAADNKGVFAFQFYAELNTYASWTAQDIVVKGSYDITPLRSTTYENILTNNAFTTGGWQTQLKPKTIN